MARFQDEDIQLNARAASSPPASSSERNKSIYCPPSGDDFLAPGLPTPVLEPSPGIHSHREMVTKAKDPNRFLSLLRTSTASRFFSEAFLVDNDDLSAFKTKAERLGFKTQTMVRRGITGRFYKKSLLVVGSRQDLVDVVTQFLESKWVKVIKLYENKSTLNRIATSTIRVVFKGLYAIFIFCVPFAVVLTMLALYLTFHDKIYILF